MTRSLKYVLINSTFAFVSAFFISTGVHELGHFISYLIFGANPTLYHNYVYTPDQQLSMHVSIISALAGPLSSLLQGIIFGAVVSRGGQDFSFAVSVAQFIGLYQFCWLFDDDSAFNSRGYRKSC